MIPKLFPGEELQFEPPVKSVATMTNSQIDDKYLSGDVRIVTEQARYPLATIPAMINTGDYDLNPEFQRRHRWGVAKQSRLIESFIMNVPVPPIFLYEDEYSHYEVMDGLQRLTAITAFYADELQLTGLTEWPELEGLRYSELPSQVRRGIDRRYLSSIILLRETAQNDTEAQYLKQMVFERINSGGEKLTDQESRNAIYDGPLNRLCLKISRNPNFCTLWDIPNESEARDNPDKLRGNKLYSKMADVELVLRFFAHRQRRRIGSGALNTYLDHFLRQGNQFPNSTLDRLEDLFNDTIELAHDLLGPQAFWLWRFRHNSWGWLERPTTTAYDAFMYVISQHLGQRDTLLARRDEIRDAIPQFYQEHVEAFDARMTNMSNLRERDELVAAFLAPFLEA